MDVPGSLRPRPVKPWRAFSIPLANRVKGSMPVLVWRAAFRMALDNTTPTLTFAFWPSRWVVREPAVQPNTRWLRSACGRTGLITRRVTNKARPAIIPGDGQRHANHNPVAAPTGARYRTVVILGNSARTT